MKSVLLLAALFLAHSAQGADYAPVTPYRPSVSSPAQLSQPGQLELELGGLRSQDALAQRGSLPYSLKLAFDSTWGLVLSGEGLVSAPAADGRQRGLGDTQLIVKQALVLDEDTALGLELGGKLPTARNAIGGSGKADYSVNGIYSQDFGALHMDANLNLTRLGAIDAGAGRIQSGWSTSFSYALDERWGVTGEYSATRRRASAHTAQSLLALSFSPSKQLTLDFGMAHGWTSATPKWSWFAGAVLPLARLW